MSKIYSLCLTTQSISDKSKTFLYRLADKIENELREINNIEYTDDKNEVIKRLFPHTSPVNHTVGELMIWEWDPFERGLAQKTLIPFYELIDITNITSITEDSIIELLKQGCEIPNYFGQKSLFVIGENENTYRVIEIDSSIVSTIKGVTKLNKNISKVNGYILSKKDFLCTEKVKVFSPDGELLPPRKIYRYLSLNKLDFVIETLSFEEKLELFINKEIKIRNYTRSQQKMIKNLFIEMLSDYDKIRAFFEENGFDQDNLLEKINQISDSINYILGDNNIRDEFCSAMIESIPKLTDRFTLLIEKRFSENNREKIEQMELQILNKKQLISDLLKQCDEYKANLELLKVQNVELQKKVKDLQNVYESLEASFSNKLIEIKQNVADFISEVAFLEQLSIGTSKSLIDDKCYLIKFGRKMKENIDYLQNVNEFVDVLSDNLEIAGIEFDCINIVSKYITSSIKQKNKLLLTGKLAFDVVNAISATVCGMDADVITVVNANIQFEDIQEQIKACSSKVVLIENIVGLNEAVTLQLLKSDLNKIIVFSNDIPETINFIPNSLLNYFNLLCLDYISEKKLKKEFIYTDSSYVKFENIYDKYTYKAAKEELEKLKNICIFSSIHCAVKSELVSIINEFGESDGIYSWLLCEAIPHQILTNNKDAAKEIINLIQLSEKHTDKLLSIIGENI